MEQDETAIEQDATSSVGSIKSRAQLEENITSLTMQIDAAVAQKDFATAATLQAQLVQLEAVRREFPTVAELKQSLIDTRKELQNAIAFKQFAVADKLQKRIDEMEHKLGEENTQEYPSVVSVPTPTKSPSGSSVDESKTPFDNERSRSIISVSTPTKSPPGGGRPVYRLRPRKPIVVNPHDSVLSVAQTISKARGDAALIVLQERGFAGVLTPHHILEKVVAKHIDPAAVSVSSVMKTKRAVTLTDSAGDALSNMLENRHRYLPVMDDKGSLVGILDIGQCLNDAIQKLERAEECSNKSAKDVVEQVASLKAGPGAHMNALQALLGPVLEQAFGNKTSPTLRSLLKGKPSTIVSPETNVREAGIIMARDDKAALVVDSGKLVGIVTVKNIMEKAVAKQVSLDVTTVTGIMTPHPLHVLPDVTALEALQIMQEDRVLSLPVCEDDGTVIGSVDVMDIIYGCGGAEGWRSIFDKSALLADDASVAVSVLSETTTPMSMTLTPRATSTHSAKSIMKVPTVITPSRSIPSLIGIPENSSQSSSTESELQFKVVYPDKSVRRLRCKPSLKTLLAILGNELQLTFLDEEGDSILVTSDECLSEAISFAQSKGDAYVRLWANDVTSKSSWWDKVKPLVERSWQ
jgi:CBS domain-containing protein